VLRYSLDEACRLVEALDEKYYWEVAEESSGMKGLGELSLKDDLFYCNGKAPKKILGCALLPFWLSILKCGQESEGYSENGELLLKSGIRIKYDAAPEAGLCEGPGPGFRKKLYRYLKCLYAPLRDLPPKLGCEDPLGKDIIAWRLKLGK
jgi:hypothetical protein